MVNSFSRFARAALLCAAIVAGCGEKAPHDPRIAVEGPAVKVDPDFVEGQRGRFFSMVTPSGKKVDFLLYRESSGEVRAVLDACRKCYRWKKGYALEGDSVVCRKCGQPFELDHLREGRGSCVPIPLSSTFEEGIVSIPLAELEAGGAYF